MNNIKIRGNNFFYKDLNPQKDEVILLVHGHPSQLEENKILVEYTYSLYAKTPIFYPFNWLFTKTFWRVYMKRVTENIRRMALNKEPYQYD